MDLVEEVRNAQRRGLETLTLISQHVAASDEPAGFFGKMSQTVAQLANAERAAFWRISGRELAALRDAYGFGTDRVHGLRLPLPREGNADGIGPLLYGGQASMVRRHEPGIDRAYARLLEAAGARDLLAVPWRTAAEPIGALIAFDSGSGFSDQDEWIMRLAARAAALVWQGYEAEQRVRQMQEDERVRLQAHAARMAELEREKSEFLQLASHELRTPITLVLGYLSMLEEGALGEMPAGAARVLPVMTLRMAQMNRLVDRLLTASRLVEQAERPPAGDMLAADVVRHVVAKVGDAAGPGGRTISIGGDLSLHALADADDAETILANLVSNAIKYSPDGGEVVITVRGEPEWTAIDVADRGIGIPAHDLARLFQPFRRLEAAASAGIEGVGLGLYLSRSLALMHGGDISASSRPGEGSVFTLRLPRSSSGEARADG